jgi:hypothetical protein
VCDMIINKRPVASLLNVYENLCSTENIPEV